MAVGIYANQYGIIINLKRAKAANTTPQYF
jgi:hypothetical protein